MNTQNAKMYFVIKMQRIGSSYTINVEKKVIEKQFTLTMNLYNDALSHYSLNSFFEKIW